MRFGGRWAYGIVARMERSDIRDRRSHISLRGLRCCKEIQQRLAGRSRVLLRQIVPAVDREPAHVIRPLTPGVERALRLARNPRSAPQREQRAVDLLPRGAVGLVVREIGGAAGAVVLAGGTQAGGILEERVVVGERAWIEGGEILRLGAGRGLPVPVRHR